MSPEPALEMDGGSGALKFAGIGAAIGGAATSVVLGLSSVLAAYFARRVVTPAQFREEDLAILSVMGAGDDAQVILPANEDTTVEGTYSLYFDRGRGHARIGRIRSYIPGEDTVTRDIEEVYSGDLSLAVRGWWSGAVYPDPSKLGLAVENVYVPVEGGSAPAWLVPAPLDQQTGTWAIMVHGRGVTRTEGLRAVPTARSLGLTSLLISYRNDGEAPAAEDRRYGLGMTEWRDVEAAIEYARTKGAKDIVLFGWSMGGAISLQTIDLSTHKHLIRALILDGPVINWIDVLAHQARLNNIPAPVGRLGQLLLTHPWGRSLTGLAAPVNLKSMNWVERASELQTPTMIIHSTADEFVPSGPSEELARRNPDMVTFVEFAKARHTKEWNVDSGRWEETVRRWLAPVLARTTGRDAAGANRWTGLGHGFPL
ncbi:MAG TPA: alpha/beta fold hydrolase [Arthrobacter sp.]|nr:alpha/beta fold hydrolase [Arthrobacter sp.]